MSLPEHLTKETFKSVISQSIPNFVVFLTKKSEMPTLVQKIADVENDGISHIKLRDFDYILKVDGDTILGRDFVKNNLVGNPDIVGGGPALLIKVSAFYDVLGGRFHPDCEDPYIRIKMQMMEKKVCGYKEKPKFLGHHPLDVPYLIALGRLYYRLGWTPVHIFYKMFIDVPHSISEIFSIGSYLLSCILRPKKMDTFDFVRQYQIRSIIRHITSVGK